MLQSVWECFAWGLMWYIALPVTHPTETGWTLFVAPPVVLFLLIFFNRSGRSRRR